jgi:methionyl-tRNA synthetase
MEKFKNALLNCAQAPEKDKAEVQKRILATLTENPSVCVTRDTAWGISVPQLPGKSVYSWVDSLLAKVSMLAKISSEQESNYWKEPDTQRHYFLGMDGTPFYGALFPALLMAAQRNYNVDHWTLMPNEVFIYEGGICSKSTGTGIWLQEALATLPADFWRFYIFFIHASVESGSERDVDFRWDRFCESINTWLLKGLSAAATNEKHVSGSDGTVEERLINGYMESGKIGQAFQLLLKTLVENPCQEKTRRLAPLLNCFLPTTGDLLAMGVKPFAIAPLYYREIQMDYQDKVDARRAQRGLAEELTDARADALCVCPINLTEQ